MDYEYESLKRYSESDRERLISNYDDPENPWIYLEITASPDSAEGLGRRFSYMMNTLKVS